MRSRLLRRIAETQLGTTTTLVIRSSPASGGLIFARPEVSIVVQAAPSGLAAADVAHVIHPLTRLRTHTQTGPVVVASAKGVTLTLEDGRELLDGTAGLWCVNVGYGRPELAKAASDQILELTYAPTFGGFASRPAIRLAERLAGLAPAGLTASFFASGGSESNETAFKLARYYHRIKGDVDRTIILSHVRAYHGLSLGATAATGLEQYHPDFGPLAAGFERIPAPYPYREPAIAEVASGAALARRIEELGPDRVAAVIAEPVLGTGGVIVPPDGYFRALRDVCDRYGVLLIADEVITGFGRTGTWWGVDHDGVVPDMLSFAKGVTSGYIPLGGVLVSEQIVETLRSVPGDPPLMHGFTYSGHPVACAVALENIRILEDEDIVTGVAEKGRHLRRRLDELTALDEVGEIRSRGLMAGVELVADRGTRERFPADRRRGAAAVVAARDRGLSTRALLNDILMLAPPLVITIEQIDRAVDILGEAIVASR